ncbi:MAG: hypothetical protein ACR2QB_08350 [Gammaproteobacteria bacterium]
MPLTGCPDIPNRRVTALRCFCVALAVVLPVLTAGNAWGDGHGPAVLAVDPQPTEISDAASPAPQVAADVPEPENEGYTDQYLFEGELAVFDDGETVDNQPYGQRLFATELIYYRTDDDVLGDDLEQGISTLWRRETQNWGVVEADLLVSDIDSSYLGREGSKTDMLFTVRQSAMPVSDILTLDNTFGHHRTRVSSLLHGGFRYRLPSSAILGSTTALTGIDSRLRFSTGKTGVYRGFALPQFEETGGRLSTLAYETRVKEDFELGAEVAWVDGDSDVRDHTSLLLAGRYELPDGSQEHSARLLGDDDGNFGLWADSFQELRGGQTIRYGGFYVDPELTWTDEPIASDQMGLYLRGDTDGYRYSLSGGYDYMEIGLNNSDSLGSTKSHSTFFSSNLRATRNISLGLNGTAALRKFTGGLVEDDQVAWRVNSFAGLTTVLGQARLELTNAELNSDISTTERSQKGIWTSFDWRLPQGLRFTNELRIEWNDDVRGETRRDEISALTRYDLLDNVSIGLNASLYRTDGNSFNADDGYSFNADARWAFLRNWYASLNASYNVATYDFDAGGLLINNKTAGSNSIWLNIGYSRSSGRPFQTFGRTTGKLGTGRISGQVFLDENRDSIRQPTETAAAGVLILLDGRYETRTDSQGRYSFTRVPTGRHEVQLLTEDVPLPWGLEDERARPVEIGFRRDSILAFPLQRMN